MKIFADENSVFFFKFYILSPPSIVSAFNHHLLARAGYVPFGTPIVSFIRSSCIVLTTHFTGLDVDVHHTWGWMK